MINKLDDAALKAVDNAVLWLWNTFGIKYANQLVFGTAVAIAVLALMLSDGGVHYHVVFWILWPIVSMAYAVLCIQRVTLPPESGNRIKLLSRKNPLVVFCRWALASVGLLGDTLHMVFEPKAVVWPSVLFWIVWWTWNLWTDALQPTQPRKKRRVTLNVLSALLQPIPSAR